LDTEAQRWHPELEHAASSGSEPVNNIVASDALMGADWDEANRRYLSAVLAEMRLALERYSHPVGEDHAEHQNAAEREVQAAEDALPAPSTLHQLTSAFDLSSFERGILLFCVGNELDGRFAALCAAAQGEARNYPTFSLAMALLAGAELSAVAPSGALRYWKLIELGPGVSLTMSPLRIDERILHFLTAEGSLDERLPTTPLLHTDHRPLTQEELTVMQQMTAAWSGDEGPPLQLHGSEHGQQRRIAAAVSETLGLRLEVMPAIALPRGTVELNNLIRLWDRENLLGGLVLLVECEESDAEDRATERALAHFATQCDVLLVIGTRDRSTLRDVPMPVFEAARPSSESQRNTWMQALGEDGRGMEPEIERVTSHFDLTGDVIEAACASLRAFADSGAPPAVKGERLWEFCRGQARSGLDRLADQVKGSSGWDDLILPEAQREMLQEIILHVRHRSEVYDRWGFGAHGGRGLGVTALFAGISGTGKTLAAEVLANELHLDLYRIDLSAVVSKYIGETEKSLRKVFDAAEEGGAVLLFDEADALFGRRSEVKDSHDRHANIEVSYLLQRMEAYRGLAILTSNLKQALDPAFMRRLRFVVDFPFPAAAERAAIWTRSIPSQAPTEGIDVVKLARLNMAGGSIRNIAVSAAFLAAEDGGVMGMRHLLRAARAESIKLEKSLSDAETRDWI
jgi:hypothetical protein